MIRWAGRAIAAWAKPRADLIVENLCLRQQLIVLQRRAPRPRLRDGDRRFWILVCRWFPTWRDSLLVVQPNTVLRWHRRGWTAYWRWRSRPRRRGGRPPLPRALRALIRRMSVENRLWGQRRVQAELARLGFPVSARTVAKYMRRPYDGVPSPTWRKFLTRHAKNIWACDFFGVRTVFFRTLYVFFVMHHETRQILQVRVTRHPTADWAAQQVVDTCGWDRDPPRYLIRDRDSRYGEAFDRRVRGLGVRQLRTPREGAAGERARGAVGPIGEERVSGSGVHRQRAASPAGAGRVRRLLQCVASPSGARPTGAVRISSDGPVQPDGPDHRAAGAWGPASCVSPCSLMVGWSCCALQRSLDAPPSLAVRVGGHRAREFRPAPPTRGSSALCPPTPALPFGPDPLGLAVPRLGGVEPSCQLPVEIGMV